MSVMLITGGLLVVFWLSDGLALLAKRGKVNGPQRYFPANVLNEAQQQTRKNMISDLPPWSSYPPPIPLWAIRKPRREFRPFFGMLPLPLQPVHPITPIQTDCSPSGFWNLPLHCIAIIEVYLKKSNFPQMGIIFRH